MNLRDCQYLTTIHQLKNFGLAAKKCFISQPALSQQIKKIEEELGVKIFERSKRRNVITTKEGMEIIKLAIQMSNLFEKMKMVANQKKQLKIGLIPTICSYLLPHIIDDLNQRLPDVKFYFSELKTDELIKQLKSGEIDIAILAFFEHLRDNNLNQMPLYEEELLLTLPENSPLDSSDFEQIMQDKKLILLEEGNCLSDNIKDICTSYQNNNFNDFYATNIETVKNMVKMKNGAAILPKLACLNEEKLKFSSFKPKKSRNIVMMFRDSFEKDFTLFTFKEIVKKCTTSPNMVYRNLPDQ